MAGSVTARDIPALAARSFPLCMSAMAGALREAHHLKHDGRQQLGLFLKVRGGVGRGGGGGGSRGGEGRGLGG